MSLITHLSRANPDALYSSREVIPMLRRYLKTGTFAEYLPTVGITSLTTAVASSSLSSNSKSWNKTIPYSQSCLSVLLEPQQLQCLLQTRHLRAFQPRQSPQHKFSFREHWIELGCRAVLYSNAIYEQGFFASLHQ